MSLDPAALSPYRGRLIGSNWDVALNSSAVSKELHSLWSGVSSYRLLPKAYREALIILDDANHATKAWGSVNSRVFDGLACSRLVVTDGERGSEQVFRGRLPHWNSSTPGAKSSERLRKVLSQFISSDGTPTVAYKRLQAALTAEVHAKHSYIARAQSLGEFLGGFGVTLNDKLGAETPDSRLAEQAEQLFSRKNCQICVGVRTMPTHYDKLPLLIASLLQQQAMQSGVAAKAIDLHLFVINTQMHTRHNRMKLQRIVDDCNEQHGGAGRSARLLYDPLAEQLTEERLAEKCTPMGAKAPADAGLDGPNALFGYEESDMLLSYLLQRWHGRDRDGGFRCDWLMFTNGDNMFSSAWLQAIAPAIFTEQSRSLAVDTDSDAGTKADTAVPVQMIAWDFTTHHPRSSPYGVLPNQIVRVDLDQRGYVDLSSFLVKAQLVAQAGATFLPDGPFTTDIFARDFFFVQQLRRGMVQSVARQGAMQNLSAAGVVYVHQNLLLHQ